MSMSFMALVASLTSQGFVDRVPSWGYTSASFSMYVHYFLSTYSFLPSCKPNKKGGLSLIPIQLICNIWMALLYKGVLSNAFLNLLGDWYSLLWRLCGEEFHILWHDYWLSALNSVRVSSKWEMACSWVERYIGSILPSLEMMLWVLITTMGLIYSTLI